ncbi:MAG: hypothetical protein ACXACY_26090 [Candidatus Hodarchaeales archaeon]|jgi:hypothetical protein
MPRRSFGRVFGRDLQVSYECDIDTFAIQHKKHYKRNIKLLVDIQMISMTLFKRTIARGLIGASKCSAPTVTTLAFFFTYHQEDDIIIPCERPMNAGSA